MKLIRFLWLAVLLVGLPLFVLAQVTVPDPNDPGAFLKAVFDAINGKDWYVTAGLAVVGAIWAVRKFLAPKVAFFATDAGGVVLNLGMTFGLGLSAALLAHQPVTLALLGKLLAAAFTLGGGWAIARKLLRAFGPLLGKIPGIGGVLAKVAAWLSGGDVPAKVTEVANLKYEPETPGSGPSVASSLDKR